MKKFNKIGDVGLLETHHPENGIIMKDINFGNRLGILRMRVNTGEGSIPHFHLDNDEKDIHISICMNKPKYYYHYNESEHKLNDDEKEILMKELKTKIVFDERYYDELKPLWYSLIYFWNSDFRNKYFSYRKKIPNYKKLK